MLAFFLIMPSVMIVSVLLVHALANRLGLRIYPATLAAVAILSFPVTYAASLVTPAAGRSYLLSLGVIILATAFVLTLANRFLLKKQREEEKIFDEEVKAAYEAERRRSLTSAENEPVEKFSLVTPAYNESSSELDEKKSSEAEDSPDDKKISEAEDLPDDKKSFEIEDSLDDKKISEAEDSLDDKKSFEIEDLLDEKKSSETEDLPDDKKSFEIEDSLDDKKISEAEDSLDDKKSFEIEDLLDDKKLSEADSELLEKPVQEEKFPFEKVFEPLSELKHEDADKPIKLPEKSEESTPFPLEEVFKPLSKIKPEEVPVVPLEKKSAPEEIFPLQEVFQPLADVDIDKLEKNAREEKDLPHEEETNPEEKIDTLDELLDKAYDERDKGHVWQAIAIYKKALERYRNDEYAPFVAIDLVNLYKEQALYSDAIKIYEAALTLPTVERNDSTRKEFVNGLEYLRVVHNVLLKHHTLSTPFSQLSKEILQEVDIEFQKVQINSGNQFSPKT